MMALPGFASVAKSESLRARVLAPLIAAPGQRLFNAQIAALTGVPEQTCATVLNAAYHRTTGVRPLREQARTHSGVAFVYWIGEPVTNEVTRVRAWLKKHRRAAKISVLAKALHLEFAATSKILADMYYAKELVRCELPLGGMDCYEYRLMGVV
jgi:hypothetical protein